jgi:hypothetical protein
MNRFRFESGCEISKLLTNHFSLMSALCVSSSDGTECHRKSTFSLENVESHHPMSKSIVSSADFALRHHELSAWITNLRLPVGINCAQMGVKILSIKYRVLHFSPLGIASIRWNPRLFHTTVNIVFSQSMPHLLRVPGSSSARSHCCSWSMSQSNQDSSSITTYCQPWYWTDYETAKSSCALWNRIHFSTSVACEKRQQSIDRGNDFLSGQRMESYQAWPATQRGDNLSPYDRFPIRSDQNLIKRT